MHHIDILTKNRSVANSHKICDDILLDDRAKKFTESIVDLENSLLRLSAGGHTEGAFLFLLLRYSSNKLPGSADYYQLRYFESGVFEGFTSNGGREAFAEISGIDAEGLIPWRIFTRDDINHRTSCHENKLKGQLNLCCL